MKTPTKFVNQLSEKQRVELYQLMKTANEQVRRRTHAILLSARGYSIDQIADIYEVDRDTVSILPAHHFGFGKKSITNK